MDIFIGLVRTGSLQALTTPQRKKSAGRSVDAMFYIVVTLITPQSFKIRPLEGFEKIAFFIFSHMMAKELLSELTKRQNTHLIS